MSRKPPSRRRRAKPGDKAVVVRMYNVGFGDAFLVRVPTPMGTRKILFDCGSIKAAVKPIRDVVRQLIEDVRDDDGIARIDVVVATHRHRDHVSGFDNPAWAAVEVREVWMPWTEDPQDPVARRIRDTQSRLAASLSAAFDAQLASPALDAAARTRAERFKEVALNALSNEAAMTTLHGGFVGDPQRRFLPTKRPGEQTFRTDALPGVVVHVIGPSRDESVIREMDPPAGKSYLRLVDGGDVGAAVPEPFNEDWWVPLDQMWATNLVVSDECRRTIQTIGSGLEGVVAATLEKAVNGTSLMLMLQIGSVYVLCPGDAQWGTWQAALGNAEWRSLLKRTTFYKIGHHGSHNATPVEFVEQTIGRDFWAMASTTHVDQWPLIPKRELMEALGDRTRKIARSDREKDAPKDVFTVKPGLYVETRIPLSAG